MGAFGVWKKIGHSEYGKKIPTGIILALTITYAWNCGIMTNACRQSRTKPVTELLVRLKFVA